MPVTFTNNTFTNADSAVGAIVNTNVLGLPVVALVGTSLTGSLGVTSVTVNGTIGAVGSTASVSLNAAGIALTDPNSTYVGYNLVNGVYVYYFNVAGTNTITGQLATVGVAVSAEGVPGLVGVQLQTITAGAAPADPVLQSGATYGAPVFQSASVNGNTVTLAYNETLGTPAPLPGAFTVAANGTAVAVQSATVSGQTVILTLAAPVANGQAVTVGYTDPSIGNDTNAIQDVAGNDAPSVLLAIATNNTPQAPGPVLQSATANGNTVTLAYNETLSTTGPLPGSFAVSVNGAAALILGATVSGQNVVLTLATPVANGQTVTVGYNDPTTGNDVFTVQDVVGNDAATSAPMAATNNTPQALGPVLQTATVNGNTVTLAYNEALSPVGPAALSFNVTVGGTAVAVLATAVSGQNVVLTLATPVANGQAVTVAYNDPTTFNDLFAVQDTVGNDAATTITPIAAANTTPQAPGPVLQAAAVNGNTVTLVYSETLSATGPDAGSFAVTVDGRADAVAAATVSGQTVTLTLATPVANGQVVTVGYTDPSSNNDVNAVQDSVGNDAATTTTPVTAVNVTPQAPGPVLQTATVAGTSVTLAYNEALSATGPAPTSFAVTVDGVAASVTAATVSGQNVVLTLATPVANGQTVTVRYTDPTIFNDVSAVQDTVGNDAATIFTPVTATNATPQAPGPVFQAATVTGNTLTLAYNETLSTTGPATTSFAVTVDGVAANVSAATVAGQTVILTLSTPVANGQAVTVAYTDPSGNNDVNAVQDAVGNDAATLGATSATNATLQAPGPVLQAAVVTGTTVTLTYNEALSASGPAPGSFAVMVDGAVANVSAAAVSGQTVTLTLATAVANGQAVTVGYTDPSSNNDVNAVQDTVGNDAATTLVPIVALNTTPQAAGPVLQTATVDSNVLTLTYDEALSLVGPTPGAFAVTVAGTSVGVLTAAVSGRNVILTLATPATNGQAVTVAYTDPSGSNDLLAVQDTVGNDSSTTTPFTATNNTPMVPGPVLQTASVNGSALTLTYNELLGTPGPAPTSFTVTVDGVVASVSAATVLGQTVTLALATPVANGQTVTVGYTDPTPNFDDSSAVQDTLGNDAASTLSPTTATNDTPQGVGPLLQTATVTGNTLTLGYSETLSAIGPDAGSFAVTAGGAVVQVTSATVAGQTVILTLATPVANGQAVTVGYTDPSGNNDVNAVQDTLGNDAGTAFFPVVTNATPEGPGPVLQTATVSGNTVTLAYDEALSPNGPPPTSFTVMVDNAVAPVTTAMVSGQTVVLTLLTPVANGQTVTVGYTDPTPNFNDAFAVQDTVGNDAGTTTTPVTATNNTPQAPGPVLQTASVTGNIVTLGYNEVLSLVGPATDAFAVNVEGAVVNVTNATVSGQTVILTLATPVANGQTVTVGYNDPTTDNDVNAVQDTVGNDAATTLTPITADNTTPQAPGPVLQTATVTGNTVTLAYDEALSTTGPDAGSFAVTVDGRADAVATATVAGQTVVLTLATPVANGQNVTVAYTDPSGNNDVNAVQDTLGNDAGTTFVPVAVTNATPQAPGPVLQTATVTGNTVTLAYDEALSPNGPVPTSFTVMVDNAAAPVTAAMVSGQTVVLTLLTPVANGQTVTVGYTDPTPNFNDAFAVQDTVGNDAGTTTTPVTATNNTPQAPGPVLQTASVTGNIVTLGYNEVLSLVGPATDAFAVSVEGAVVNVTNATVSGQTVTLTLATPVANGQTVTVGYTDPTTDNDVNAVQDTVGNDAATTVTPITAANTTPQAPGPVLQTATVTGNTVTLAYNEALSPVGPDASSFAVTVDGAVANVSAATVSGQAVTLTLATPVTNGQTVTVGYTDPSGNNDVNAVQDTVGNDAATTLAPVAVTNATPQAPGPVLQTATVAGNTVTLAYNEALSPIGPNLSSFAVQVDGRADAVAAAAVSGQTVVLTLATPVTNGQAVTVGYTDPTTGNDVNAVQDTAGNDAASVPATTATNTTAQAPGPVLQSASANGSTVTLAYSEALSSVGPAAGSFTITADGVADAVTSATVAGQTVVLTLATPVANGQAVTVGYTDPTAGNDLNAVQDTAGNDAASVPATAVANNTAQAPGPVLQSASADGSTVTLAYSEALSPAGPAPSSFAVTADGTPVTVTGATVSGQNVVLTLATPVAAGQAVTVGYTDPTAGNDVNAVQDTAGNDAGSVPATAVANNTAATGGADPTGNTMTPGSTMSTDPVTGDTTVVTTTPLGNTTSLVLPNGSTVAQGTGLAAGDIVSIDPSADFEGRGQFTITGHVASPSGVSSVTLSAVIDGGPTTVLGVAAVASDGSYTFLDTVGAHLQGFITATLTDDIGGVTAVQSPYSLEAGLRNGSYVAEQDRYSSDGSQEVALMEHHRDKSATINITASGQSYYDNYFDTFHNGGAPDNVFVFNPGHGLDVVTGFRAGGADHDVLDLNGSGGVTLADVLRHTRNVAGGVLITDPYTQDTVKLTGVDKAELRANPADIRFHS